MKVLVDNQVEQCNCLEHLEIIDRCDAEITRLTTQRNAQFNINEQLREALKIAMEEMRLMNYEAQMMRCHSVADIYDKSLTRIESIMLPKPEESNTSAECVNSDDITDSMMLEYMIKNESMVWKDKKSGKWWMNTVEFLYNTPREAILAAMRKGT